MICCCRMASCEVWDGRPPCMSSDNMLCFSVFRNNCLPILIFKYMFKSASISCIICSFCSCGTPDVVGSMMWIECCHICGVKLWMNGSDISVAYRVHRVGEKVETV